jgi:peptidoglycan L-alanyl-D-glutamate endopeptidase CwlK
MITSRNITDLLPKVQELCLAFITACHEHGIEILITSTYRDIEAQNALYAQGRTVPGKRVTNASGGSSFHNYRVAFDFVPLVNGKAIWNDVKLFGVCGGLAEGVGLEWAGRWKTFKELAHCQFTDGLTLADFKAGKTLGA